MTCHRMKNGLLQNYIEYVVLCVLLVFPNGRESARSGGLVVAWQSSLYPAGYSRHVCSRPDTSAIGRRHPTHSGRIKVSPVYSIRLPFGDDGDEKKLKKKSKQQPPPPPDSSSGSSFIAGFGKKFSPKEDAKKEEEKSEDDDGGFFRGWFKKDSSKEKEEKSTSAKAGKPTKGKQPSTGKKDTEEDSILKKVQSVLPKAPESFPSPQKNATLKKGGSEAEDSTSDSSLFGKIQGLFSRNVTAADDDGKAKKTPEGNATNLNPLSSFQKLLALDRFTPVEEWITVFPKTRIMPGQIVPVTIAGLDLLVIASRDGRKLYCIVNSCPHLGTPLETGALVRLPRESSPSSSSSSSINNPRPSGGGSSGTGLAAPPNPLSSFTEKDVTNLLSQDGCEDCIVCPLHRTAFALESGDVRGEWCPYPPILGNLMGNVKKPVGVAVFDIRTRGKFIQVRLNTPLPPLDGSGPSPSSSSPSR